MANIKAVNVDLLDAGMIATANAIREKTGGSEPIRWDSAQGFKASVEAIQTGGSSLIATMQIAENQGIAPEVTSYINDVTMEGETV